MPRKLESNLVCDGVELLREGEVVLSVERNDQLWEIREVIISPLDAAYYALLRNAYTEKEILTSSLKLKTSLGRAIARHVPDWRDIMEERRLDSEVFDKPKLIDPEG